MPGRSAASAVRTASVSAKPDRPRTRSTCTGRPCRPSATRSIIRLTAGTLRGGLSVSTPRLMPPIMRPRSPEREDEFDAMKSLRASRWSQFGSKPIASAAGGTRLRAEFNNLHLDRRFHLVGRERKRAQPRAHRVEYGVGDRGRDDRGRRLAGAPGLLAGAVDQVDVDLRYLREGKDRVALPVEAGDPGAVERHLFLEGAAHRLDDVALDLLTHAVRIDDLAAIVGDEEPRPPDLAGFEIG